MLTLVTSCSNDDEKGGTDEAWKELSKDYTAENLSIGTVSTSGKFLLLEQFLSMRLLPTRQQSL